ncbi:AraC family transcriptional regulator [Acetobacter sp.]|uniref:AraC family transcriptional regulator n=1 Tax=Acetobacter sp. TaxID=440 RepID=UPI0039ECBD46
MTHSMSAKLAWKSRAIVGRMIATTFVSRSHLINQFRRHFGVTPKQYATASR